MVKIRNLSTLETTYCLKKENIKLINVIYNYEYDDLTEQLIIGDDVDIVCVPDIVCENLDATVHEFFNWTSTKESGCWKTENGELVCCVDTEDFIRWINIKYFNSENKNAYIVEQHTKYNPNYPIAEF